MSGIAVDPRRVKRLNKKRDMPGPVVYWMSRDQRVEDNWALLYAQELAHNYDSAIMVVFCLAPQFLRATARQYEFMIAGLEQVEKALIRKNIPFQLLAGNPADQILALVTGLNCGAVVTDFDPLKIKHRWKSGIAKPLEVPFFEVDAHNIVPCLEASSKQEYAAYTIRPKISRMLGEFLTEFPKLSSQKPASLNGLRKADWRKARQTLKVDNSVGAVSWIKPGSSRAVKALQDFIENGLSRYAGESNDPNALAQSGLSPYLHFGQISAQWVALEVSRAGAAAAVKAAFLEELIVRRELSDNFCYYNKHYDSTRGFPEWARKTLDEHRSDPRTYLYNMEQFETAQTHDDLWNAAQMEMSKTGKMHGYLRMYWAKKALEWTRSPEAAMDILIRLNDRYELDGRDPNGYVGVAWSIGGVHDRAWKERGIFGKIRYMSYEGCRRKFDVDSYIERINRIDLG